MCLAAVSIDADISPGDAVVAAEVCIEPRVQLFSRSDTVFPAPFTPFREKLARFAGFPGTCVSARRSGQFYK